MPVKTEISETSTQAEPKAASFLISKNREMFKDKKSMSKIDQNVQLIPNDLIMLNPSYINSVSWPEACILDNNEVISIKGNYYSINDMRGHESFIARNSQTRSELIYFNADKPTNKIILTSIERYPQKNHNKSEEWFHINITKYEESKNLSETANFHIKFEPSNLKDSQQVWHFQSFQLIQNAKKGVLIIKVIDKCVEGKDSLYKVLLLNLQEFKSKSPLRNKSFEEKDQINSSSKSCILASNTLDCGKKFGSTEEEFIKTIKSQFGDVILICTNKEIYQLEIEDMGEDYILSIKPYKASRLIASKKEKYLRTQKKIEQSSQFCLQNKEEDIKDAQFVSNGLKVMILTTLGAIVVIEAQNFLYSDNMKNMMENTELSHQYFTENVVCEKIYSVNGNICVQFHSLHDSNLIKKKKEFIIEVADSKEDQKQDSLTYGLIILKTQNNGFAFSKIIAFPGNKKDILHLVINPCSGVDEIILQFIKKQQSRRVKLLKYQLLMSQLNNNTIICELNYENKSNSDVLNKKQTKIANQSRIFPHLETDKTYLKAEMTNSSRLMYLLSERQLACFKGLDSKNSSQNKHIVPILEHIFFEKPLNISVSPLTQHLAIVFKQFVKFFYFSYSSIKLCYTLKLKNVGTACYSPEGNKIIIGCSNGMIYLVDAYTFEQKFLFQFHGEPKTIQMIDQRNILIKSSKNILSYFQQGLTTANLEGVVGQFTKQYDIKLEEKEKYFSDLEQTVVVRKNGAIEVYLHQKVQIEVNISQVEKQILTSLNKIHKHLSLTKNCFSYEQQEYPTSILLSKELGFLFVATNLGKIKQYIWPLPSTPSLDVFTQQIFTQKIISIRVDATFSQLFAICETGNIAELSLTQFIGGEKMSNIYLLNKKYHEGQFLKREFTDRGYILDKFTPIQLVNTLSTQQNKDQLEFIIDKINDDIEEVSKAMKSKGKEILEDIRVKNKKEDRQLKDIIEKEESDTINEICQLKDQIEMATNSFDTTKQQEEKHYQTKLLELYKESDRLTRIHQDQDQKLSAERNAFIREHNHSLQALIKEKNSQLVHLEANYQHIETKKDQFHQIQKLTEIQDNAQLEQYKFEVHRQVEAELSAEQQNKELLLGSITKIQKQINNFKQRSNYFQNLILETKVQLSELGADREEYQKKKQFLREQLTDKQEVIEKIEKELVEHLKNTENMKMVKNTHEFELEEYENQVTPINDSFHQVEANIKQMNLQIMKQYNYKINKENLIRQALSIDQRLRMLKKKKISHKLEIKNQFLRLAERLTQLSKDPFHTELRKALKSIVEEDNSKNESLNSDIERENNRREGQKLMRYKAMIRKEIEEEEKRQEHILKNQHQFYRYHVDNTTLVRQFNQLTKLHKHLQDQQNKINHKLDHIRHNIHPKTPLKRSASIHIRKIHDKKLTPFQRYEEETQEFNPKKNQNTSDTKLTRNSESLSFLKGLLKEVNQTDSKYQQMEIMKERVRTFVNPELKIRKTQEVKKLLFGRGKVHSDMLKLK